MAESSVAYDLTGDVRAVEMMATRLVPYVYEDDLYGLMPGDMPKLTIGGLLMRLHRLKAIRGILTPAQQTQVEKAEQKMLETRQKWRVAYEGKLKREFSARLVSINQLVNDGIESPRILKDNYPAVVDKRLIAQAIAEEAIQLEYMVDDAKGGLQVFDNKLRRYVEKAPFILDARLAAAYPEESYWYVYAKVVLPTSSKSER